MKKVKDWLSEKYNIIQGSDLAITLYDIWEEFAASKELAQKMLDDEMDKDITEEQFELIEKEKIKKKSCKKVFL